jgi:hypothetical protein
MFDKNFKCPKYLKRWSLDRKSFKILMAANATYMRAHKEAIRKKGEEK